jgi:outer membrane protein assembly factor BamB
MMDVPNRLAGAESASLLAFDAATGRRRWVLPLKSTREAFSHDLVVTDSTREPPLLMVITPDGDAIRVHIPTGSEIWRAAVGPGRFVALGPDSVTIRQSDAEIELDLAGGFVW